MSTQRISEHWATKLGVILAVAGSAVGLGNFLRFPGRAAMYGGGAFLIPYFVSLIVLGIPIAWVEWTVGRQGARYGLHSAPALFLVISRGLASRVFGALAVFIPVIIYMYYVFIEAWCLGYAWAYLTGGIDPGDDPALFGDYFATYFNDYIGSSEHGALVHGIEPAVVFLAICFALNFALVYRGLSRGIERFCRLAMPALILAAIVMLVRVLTLGTPNPELPEQNVVNGLGFMWNPKPVEPGAGIFSALLDPTVWLEAAGQIFFSLSVGFGIIMTYSSYLRRNDDVALSGLSAAATNEVCEVALGGLITIPAAFLFLGAAPLAKLAGSSIGLGFLAVPVVFEYLYLGHLFGFVWFGLLFLAAITSSVSMLQPAIAFLEEGFDFDRKRAALVLGLLTGGGAFLVVYLSRNTVALDVMDFWVGSAALIVLALFEVILFGWVLGAERGLEETNRASDIRVPRFFAFVIRWICPTYLIFILGGFALQSFPAQVAKVAADPAALVTVGYMAAILALFLWAVGAATKRWHRDGRFDLAPGEDRST
jgi:neurotransmitter:Na+ symporter, NSS family